MKLFIVLPDPDAATHKIRSTERNYRCVKAKKWVGDAVTTGQSIEPKTKHNANPVMLG